MVESEKGVSDIFALNHSIMQLNIVQENNISYTNFTSLQKYFD